MHECCNLYVGSGSDMDAQVTAALISGGAGLTVAVLGIGGAIAAQLLTTRHAFANSLALQEQQYAKQENERREQSLREDAYRFAEQRRSTYGRFVRLAREYLYAVEVEHSAADTLGRIGHQRNRSQPGSHDLDMSAETAEQLVADARERKRQLHGEFGAACEEIYLLGSQEATPGTLGVWGFLVCTASGVLYLFLSLFSWRRCRSAGMGGTRVSRRAWRAVPRSRPRRAGAVPPS